MRLGGLVHDVLRVGFAALGVVATTYQSARPSGNEESNEGNYFSLFPTA